MRRALQPPALSPAVLRHFAVLTLVITGGLAMFASGENQEYLAEQVRQRQMQTEALRAQREKATQRTVVVDGLRLAPGTRLGNPDVGDAGPPIINTVPAAPVYSADFPPPPNVNVSTVRIGPDGLARDAAGMVIPLPAMNMRTRGKPGQPRPRASGLPPSEQEVNAMIEASARRAGRPSGE